MRIIDADGHVTESNIPWRDLLPESYSSRAPTVVKDNRGGSMIMVEGKLCPKPVGKGCGFVGAPRGRSPQAATGMSDPVRRLQDMDLEESRHSGQNQVVNSGDVTHRCPLGCRDC